MGLPPAQGMNTVSRSRTFCLQMGHSVTRGAHSSLEGKHADNSCWHDEVIACYCGHSQQGNKQKLDHSLTKHHRHKDAGSEAEPGHFTGHTRVPCLYSRGICVASVLAPVACRLAGLKHLVMNIEGVCSSMRSLNMSQCVLPDIA